MHQWFLSVMKQIKMSALLITQDIDEAILLSDRTYILAGRPGKIVDEVKIELSKPRNREIILSDEFIRYKRYIIEKIGS